jgi:hypothetical protein
LPTTKILDLPLQSKEAKKNRETKKRRRMRKKRRRAS